MKRQAILIFSHELTGEQKKELKDKWGVNRIVPMPEDISDTWRNVPPEISSLKSFVRPVLEWLVKVAFPDDVVLVQGDFGATFIVVNFSLKLGLVPVYSTTKRDVTEEAYPGGEVRQNRIFKHQMFRRYGE